MVMTTGKPGEERCGAWIGGEGAAPHQSCHPLGRWGTVSERKPTGSRGRTDGALDMGSLGRDFEGMKANLWQISSRHAKQPEEWVIVAAFGTRS